MSDGHSEQASLRAALVASLSPARRQRPGPMLGLLGAIGALQLAGFLYLARGGVFGNPPLAWDEPRIIAKLVLFGGSAIVFSVLTVLSLSPDRRGLGRWGWMAGGIFTAAMLLFFDKGMPPPGLLAAMQPKIGIGGLLTSITLSLPVFLLLAFAAKEGASTRPRQTAAFSGLAAGSWGIFVYATQCPLVSVYYLVPWYGGAVAFTALLAWALVQRFARW